MRAYANEKWCLTLYTVLTVDCRRHDEKIPRWTVLASVPVEPHGMIADGHISMLHMLLVSDHWTQQSAI